MVFISTVLTSAVIYLVSLKGLYWFQFLQKDTVNDWIGSNTVKSWVLLLLLLIVLSCILYFVGQWLSTPIFAAIFIGIFVSIGAIFFMKGKLSWHNISVPFIACTVLYCHFIFTTARFHFYNSKLRQSK